MNRDYEQTEFSKALLAGVFAGIAATVLSLIYNIVFRGVTGFPLSLLINVSTVIFCLLVVVTVAGLIFYLFHHYLKRGAMFFQIAAVLVTVLLVLGTMQVQRSNDLVLAREFRELLLGIVLITGVCTVFVIPFLFNHDYV
jgi:drug/metabolite transporter (DMT)-like permease